jgi:hypothetical protein
MQALYRRGFENGKNGKPFLNEPPELSNRPAAASVQ